MDPWHDYIWKWNGDTDKADSATHLLNGTFTLLLDTTNVLFCPKVLKENLH